MLPQKPTRPALYASQCNAICPNLLVPLCDANSKLTIMSEISDRGKIFNTINRLMLRY